LALAFVLGCKTDTQAEAGNETGGGSPDAYAAAECAALLACACQTPVYASLDECIEQRSEQLAALAAVASERGMTWDAGCAQARLDRLTAGCTDDYDNRDYCMGEWCALYVGDKPQGSECDELGRAELLSECAAGAICRGGSCNEYCHVFEGGELCGDTFLGAMCPPGTSCIYVDLSSSCGTPPGEGEFCSAVGPSCGAGLVCADDMTCTPKPAIGEACISNACVDAGWCDMGTCVADKPDGDPCTSSLECASSFCDTDTCAALPDQAGDSCASSYECAEGLVCDSATLTCLLVEPETCTFAALGCAVEYNGVCDEQAMGGACAVDEDYYDCGYCPQIWQTNGVCNEGSGSCPPGSDPECP
jgi:hypothetical protein